MSKENDGYCIERQVSSVLSKANKSELETFTLRNLGSLVGVLIFFILVVLSPAICSARDDHVIVRDSSGNVVETKDRHGNETIVRDRSGDLIRTEGYNRWGSKIIRDREGNVIGTEDRD
jgi:hypothetical protein